MKMGSTSVQTPWHSHRPPPYLFKEIKKAPILRISSKDRRCKSSLRCHLVWRIITPTHEMPTHLLPLTQAYVQDTEAESRPFPSPSGAHLPFRFLPCSQRYTALCECANGVTSPSLVCLYYSIPAEVCQLFFEALRPCVCF